MLSPTKTFFVSFILLVVNKLLECKLFDDICDTQDVKCKKPNILNTIGELQPGKYSKGEVLVRKHQISMLECIKECFITSNCTAINYRRKWNFCDLVNESSDDVADDKEYVYSNISTWPKCTGINYRRKWKFCDLVKEISENVTDDKEYVYINSSTWPKTIAGKCAETKCPEGKKCQRKNGENKCVLAYCKGEIPPTENATLLDEFGLTRDVGTVLIYKCKKDYLPIGRTHLICNGEAKWEKLFCCIPKQSSQTLMNGLFPRNCNAIPKYCGSRMYEISPKNRPFDVYCDMDKKLIWHIIQNRRANGISFHRGWEDYENGFGTYNSGMWLGLWNIHQLTSSGISFLKIQLQTYTKEKKVARYKNFQIGDDSSQYRLTIGGYLSSEDNDAGDSFSHHNDMKFSTFDQDNDLRNSSTHKIPGVNCALMFGGGWWFKNCHDVNLNGIYGDWQETVNSSYYAVGIHWTKITNHKFSLTSSIMKIRPCIPSDNCTSQN